MRTSKHEYYIGLAREASKRSTCQSMKVGAVLVKDDQVISLGYNGASRGVKSCDEIGYCIRRKMNITPGTRYSVCRAAHADCNVIVSAARAGVSCIGADIYLYAEKLDGTLVRAMACNDCKKLIINAGIKMCYYIDKDGEIKRQSVNTWVKNFSKVENIEDCKEGYENSYDAAATHSVG